MSITRPEFLKKLTPTPQEVINTFFKDGTQPIRVLMKRLRLYDAEGIVRVINTDPYLVDTSTLRDAFAIPRGSERSVFTEACGDMRGRVWLGMVKSVYRNSRIEFHVGGKILTYKKSFISKVKEFFKK